MRRVAGGQKWRVRVRYYVIIDEGYDGLDIMACNSRQDAEKEFLREDRRAFTIIAGQEIKTDVKWTKCGRKDKRHKNRIIWLEPGHDLDEED